LDVSFEYLKMHGTTNPKKKEQSVPKRQYINFRRWGNHPKERENSIQNMEKFLKSRITIHV
jgi:hypothetical protein